MNSTELLADKTKLRQVLSGEGYSEPCRFDNDPDLYLSDADWEYRAPIKDALQPGFFNSAHDLLKVGQVIYCGWSGCVRVTTVAEGAVAVERYFDPNRMRGFKGSEARYIEQFEPQAED